MEKGRGVGSMPWKQKVSEQVHATPDTIVAVGAAAVGVIVQYTWGLVDVMAFVTVLLWTLDMIGGSIRAMVVAAREAGLSAALKALTIGKFGEGLVKLAAIGIGFLMFAGLEIAQLYMLENYGHLLQMTGVTLEHPLPMVLPMLLAAQGLLLVSILDQLNDLWGGFGRAMSRVARTYTDATGRKDRRFTDQEVDQ